MFKFQLTILITIFCYILGVHCRVAFKDLSSESLQCRDICADSFFLLPIITDAQSICQRGCRFFTLIYAQDDHDLSAANEKCYSSCDEAYDALSSTNNACHVGCSATLKQKETDLASILVFLEKDKSSNFLFLESERELLETDQFSDPLVRAQAEHGYDPNYKIPETRIRTMPVAAIIEERLLETRETPTTWLDCASKNSGIPKWILLSAILIAILVALWLSIFSEKKEVKTDSSTESLCKSDEFEDDVISKKDPNLICDSHNCANASENEINFSLPPKFVVETEKV